MRDAAIAGDRMRVVGEELDIGWADLPARLEEAAVLRVLTARARPDDALWVWEQSLAALATAGAP
jgi:hypothetical protein